MHFEPFEMERMQARFETRVRFNLSESGVHPVTLGELIDAPDERAALLSEPLAYTQSNGSDELRAAIASLYRGATASNVLVTNGSAEANFLSLVRLLSRGDHVVLMAPNYMQALGLARGLGASVSEWRFLNDGAHQPDAGLNLEALRRVVRNDTKVIVLCNPNNPTGYRLSEQDVRAVCEIAASCGAWVVSDEVYRGAELDGQTTTSAWMGYSRVIVTGGLSKAYGLPGLRVGWLVADEEMVEALWSYRDYVSISPSALSDRLARYALEASRRTSLLERTRAILLGNARIMQAWIAAQGGALTSRAPAAGGVWLLGYRDGPASSVIADRLRVEHDVLVVPGEQFNLERCLRIGYGAKSDVLTSGLAHVQEVLASCGPRLSKASGV